MSANLKPYPAMKDSGVPWLGEVPTYWEVWHLRLRNGPKFQGLATSTSTKEDDETGGHSVRATTSTCLQE